MRTCIWVEYKRRKAIAPNQWASYMDYGKYLEVHNVLLERNDGFNTILFNTIIEKGFEWAFNITDDDIEQARKEFEAEAKEGEAKGVKLLVANGATMSEQMITIKRIAEILETPGDLLAYIVLSKEIGA